MEGTNMANAKSSRPDMYTRITDKMVAALEQGDQTVEGGARGRPHQQAAAVQRHAVQRHKHHLALAGVWLALGNGKTLSGEYDMPPRRHIANARIPIVKSWTKRSTNTVLCSKDDTFITPRKMRKTTPPVMRAVANRSRDGEPCTNSTQITAGSHAPEKL
jgi:hypothetical protein